MSELIELEKVIDEVNAYKNCVDMCANTLKDNILDIPTVNAIPIPKGATNGDMWLLVFGGEVVYITENANTVVVKLGRMERTFRLDWWNAPYKRGEEQ